MDNLAHDAMLELLNELEEKFQRRSDELKSLWIKADQYKEKYRLGRQIIYRSEGRGIYTCLKEVQQLKEKLIESQHGKEL